MAYVSAVAYKLLNILAESPAEWLDTQWLRHIPDRYTESGVRTIDTETLYAEMEALVQNGWAEVLQHDPLIVCQNCVPHSYWHITSAGLRVDAGQLAHNHPNGLIAKKPPTAPAVSSAA